jgi:hypothetical protein
LFLGKEIHMARYLIPAFEVETIEDLRVGNSGKMLIARMVNGWDLWIPVTARPQRLPEPLPALEDGYYTMTGYTPVLKRRTDFYGDSIWLEWDGETWLGCGMVSYMTENNEIVRSKLNFLGGN